MQKAVFLILWLLISCPLLADSAEDPQVVAARQKVYDFERSMHDRQPDGHDSKAIKRLHASEAYRQELRTFFTSLKSPTEKIAALDLFDNRYVYLMDRQFASDLLGDFVRDSDLSVRSRATKAIGYNGCGRLYVTELLVMLQNEPPVPTLLNLSYAMGRSDHAPFVPHLVNLLEHESPQVRSKAIFELLRLSKEAALPYTIKLLNDSQPSVRISAVQGLTAYEGKIVGPHVERLLLNDPVDHVRERALWTLGHLQDYDSTECIAKHLSDPVDKIRAHACESLGAQQAREYAPAIVKMLQDPDVVVRRYAVIALGKIGNPSHIPHLEALANDGDEQIRELSLQAIKAITQAAYQK